MQNVKASVLVDFEQISSFQSDKLVGGFSNSFSVRTALADTVIGNNCQGANCAHGCGGDNNVYCNTTVGCGPKT
jgi:hypothetical protein